MLRGEGSNCRIPELPSNGYQIFMCRTFYCRKNWYANLLHFINFSSHHYISILRSLNGRTIQSLRRPCLEIKTENIILLCIVLYTYTRTFKFEMSENLSDYYIVGGGIHNPSSFLLLLELLTVKQRRRTLSLMRRVVTKNWFCSYFEGGWSIIIIWWYKFGLFANKNHNNNVTYSSLSVWKLEI